MSSHRYPCLDELGWKNLLNDVLEMHNKLFTSILREDCYEIVLHSLLCSGKPESITFAGKMMECNNKQRKDKHLQNLSSFKLPYLKTVNLVLTASREYFNSSSTSSDPCLALSRACLNLIEDVPSSIEVERDLIASLSLLQEFNVNILPLQVRLCENKLSLIKEALEKKDRAYKKSQKILQLAYLLRACSNNNHEREGKVLTLIAEKAYQVKDYQECYKICKQLLEGSHQEGWNVCYTLGNSNEFNDIQARSDLLSFSLAHCSDDLIETILRSRDELQLHVLQERVRFLMGDNSNERSQENIGGNDEIMGNAIDGNLATLWHTGEKTLHVLQNTTNTTKSVLTTVGSTKFWKDAVNWIQPLGISWEDDDSDIIEESNKILTKQGICAFYSSLIENHHISKLEANYQRYARPDLNQSQEISMCILRASLLEDFLKNESSQSSLEKTVLLDLAKAYLSEDFTFCLSLLLSLKKAEEAEILFESLPKNPLVFHFATFYYALRYFIAKDNLHQFIIDNILLIDPKNIIKQINNFNNEINSSQTENIDLKEYSKLFHKYNEMFKDFIQAEFLHSIDETVDAARFTTDEIYKKDTILGISMTLEDEVFATAISLAKRYNISPWDVCMTHLEYLFSENSVTISEIVKRIEKHDLVKILLENPELFKHRIENFIYPSIDGKDYDRLKLYYSLLEDELGIKPAIHKKLLTKFKTVVKDIDYKMLMTPNISSQYISKILNDSNVYVFAKEASKIPKEGEFFFEASNIYCMWICRYFFEGSTTNAKIPQNMTEWIHRYESCSDMMQQLNSADLLKFINHIIFTEQSLEKLNLECRMEIIKRAIKLCKSKYSKHKNDPQTSSQWNDVVSTLILYQQHLHRMEDESLVSLRENNDAKILAYYKEFDLTKSSPEELQKLLVKIVLEGPDIELLKNFLGCCPSDIEWQPSDAYLEAINNIMNEVRSSDSSDKFKNYSLLEVLEKILEDLTTFKDELMIDDMAIDQLLEFCEDINVSLFDRFNILHLLDKTNLLPPEYKDLLLLYQTQVIILSVWPELEITQDNLKDDEQRKMLFDMLINMCTEIDHYITLADLLYHWPSFPPFQDENQEPWTNLLFALASISNKDALNAVIELLDNALTQPSFTQKCCKKVFMAIQQHGSLLHILKYAFKTEYIHLHVIAKEILSDANEISHDDYDDELLELILQRKLVPQIISTYLYQPVIEFLLKCQGRNVESYKSIDNVAKELNDSGYEKEAHDLINMKSGTSSISSAFNVLNRWLPFK